MWLKNWSEYNQTHGGNPHVGKYIGIYFAFGVGSAALGVLQTLILWIFCSIEVSARAATRWREGKPHPTQSPTHVAARRVTDAICTG